MVKASKVTLALSSLRALTTVMPNKGHARLVDNPKACEAIYYGKDPRIELYSQRHG